MKQFLIGLSISVAFILGCVTAAAVTSQAQADVAPTAGGGECFAVALDFVYFGEFNKGEMPQMLGVPAGWHPVGGGATQTSPAVILCRGTSAQ